MLNRLMVREVIEVLRVPDGDRRCKIKDVDLNVIRRQFPLLESGVIYLDNAATTQKPQAVLDAMDQFYTTSNANINRGVHKLAEAATIAYDDARKTVQRFINAKKSHEVIFTRNTTESINLVAKTYARSIFKKGDVIVLTILEHHSNIVPWLQLKDEIGVQIEWVDIDDEGMIDLDHYKKILTDHPVKLVSVSAVSNVLGTRQPIEMMIDLAQKKGAVVMIDAAQMAAHEPIDVQKLNCDFLAFSGHKMYGPTGIGVLYGKEELLDTMPPFLGGGDMIADVRADGFLCAELPRKFEAGTPAIAEAVGLRAAIEWINSIGFDEIQKHEHSLLTHALDLFQKLKTNQPINVLGPSNPSKISGCISFTIDDIHPHDLTQLLSEEGVMLRAGHHCAQLLHKHLKIPASTRLSVGIYNTMEDLDLFATALQKAIGKLRTNQRINQ